MFIDGWIKMGCLWMDGLRWGVYGWMDQDGVFIDGWIKMGCL